MITCATDRYIRERKFSRLKQSKVTLLLSKRGNAITGLLSYKTNFRNQNLRVHLRNPNSHVLTWITRLDDKQYCPKLLAFSH